MRPDDARATSASPKNGPVGHNEIDQLHPWTRSVRDVLSIAELGYAYEPSSDQTVIMAAARRDDRLGARSPFWAD